MTDKPITPEITIEKAQSLCDEARRLLRRLDEIQSVLRSHGYESSFDHQSRFHCKFSL